EVGHVVAQGPRPLGQAPRLLAAGALLGARRAQLLAEEQRRVELQAELTHFAVHVLAVQRRPQPLLLVPRRPQAFVEHRVRRPTPPARRAASATAPPADTDRSRHSATSRTAPTLVPK